MSGRRFNRIGADIGGARGGKSRCMNKPQDLIQVKAELALADAAQQRRDTERRRRIDMAAARFAALPATAPVQCHAPEPHRRGLDQRPSPGSIVRFTGYFLKHTGQQWDGAETFIVQDCSCNLCPGRFVAVEGGRHIALGNLELVGEPAKAADQVDGHGSHSDDVGGMIHRNMRDVDRDILDRQWGRQ